MSGAAVSLAGVSDTTALRPERPPGLALRELALVVPGARWLSPIDAGVQVLGVSLDSRRVQPGDLYAALPGAVTHGAAFLAAAVERGAVAVLTDPAGAALAAPAAAVPILLSPDPRSDLARIAARVYGDPSRQLALVGVTGTNGKTTTSYLIHAGFAAAGWRPGLIGTVEVRSGDRRLPSARTTPESPELQALLATMVAEGARATVLEVSSHALVLHRVDACHFATAVFTNLSPEHLDFHVDMESYFRAKAMLFAGERTQIAVVNVDDAYGARLAAEVRVPVVTVSARAGGTADWVIDAAEPAGAGVSLVVRGPHGRLPAFPCRLPGTHNVANCLAALAALEVTGVDVASAIEGIAALERVPGRLEPVEVGQPFQAFVDYAHTPAAVAALLASVRPLAGPQGRVGLVLGCGGDRDRDKRAPMGAAAAAAADLVVFTSDNPRSEDPEEIVAAMLAGVRGLPAGPRARVEVELDRRAAISIAVAWARPGDVVVVAGKGHEVTQEAAGVTRAFDDRAVLRDALLAPPTGG